MTHDGLLSIERIEQLNGHTQSFFIHAQLIEITRLSERIRHGLIESRGAQRIVDLLDLLLSHRALANAASTTWQRRLDAVHAIEAQHLFIEVDLALKVGAERRREHMEQLTFST